MKEEIKQKLIGSINSMRGMAMSSGSYGSDEMDLKYLRAYIEEATLKMLNTIEEK